jgi:transglutaminase-like putative cysteine protease
MTLYRLRHETVYTYADRVSISHDVAHIVPRELPRQRIHRVLLAIEPTPVTLTRFTDYFGNPAVFFLVEEPHAQLVVRAESEVEVTAPPLADFAASTPWDAMAQAVAARRDLRALEAFECSFDSPFVARSEALAEYARPSFPPGRPVLEGARDLCARIHRDFRYDPTATSLATPLHDVLAQRHGVCQDFAHVMIGALRSLGVPARYVSGYVRSASEARSPQAVSGAQRGEAERRSSGGQASEVHQDVVADRMVGSEASHAWAQVFSPESGWTDFDPTNDVVPADQHVVLGWGRDYDDVSPIQGVTLGGGLQTVAVKVELRPRD